MNFAKFIRTPFLQNTYGRVLLKIYYLQQSRYLRLSRMHQFISYLLGIKSRGFLLVQSGKSYLPFNSFTTLLQLPLLHNLIRWWGYIISIITPCLNSGSVLVQVLLAVVGNGEEHWQWPRLEIRLNAFIGQPYHKISENHAYLNFEYSIFPGVGIYRLVKCLTSSFYWK